MVIGTLGTPHYTTAETDKWVCTQGILGKRIQINLQGWGGRGWNQTDSKGILQRQENIHRPVVQTHTSGERASQSHRKYSHAPSDGGLKFQSAEKQPCRSVQPFFCKPYVAKDEAGEQGGCLGHSRDQALPRRATGTRWQLCTSTAKAASNGQEQPEELSTGSLAGTAREGMRQ